MRKFVLMAIVMCLMAAVSFAGPLGAPAAVTGTNQLGVGFDYVTGEMDLDASFAGRNIPLEDVEMDMYLAKLVYGVNNNWDVYAVVGVADAGVDDFNGDDTVYGIGTKFNLGQAGNIKFGGLAQFLTGSVDDIIGKTDIDVDFYELTLAVGPNCDIAKNVNVYGGAMFTLFNADIDADGMSADAEQSSILGGFIGVNLELTENLSTYVEYQASSDSSFIGTGVALKF